MSLLTELAKAAAARIHRRRQTAVIEPSKPDQTKEIFEAAAGPVSNAQSPYAYGQKVRQGYMSGSSGH